MKTSLLKFVSPLLVASIALPALSHGDDKSHSHDHSEHSHTAPNGGMLVPLGEHFANLELLHDKETGKLTAFVLDGCAEKSIRLPQNEITLEIGLAKDGSTTTKSVTLAAVANVLTGETAGNTSQFEVISEDLKGVERFSGRVAGLRIKGSEVPAANFRFPAGSSCCSASGTCPSTCSASGCSTTCTSSCSKEKSEKKDGDKAKKKDDHSHSH
jgi:hypothetical protein